MSQTQIQHRHPRSFLSSSLDCSARTHTARLLCIWTIVPILIDRARRTYPSVCTVYLTMAALMVDCVFVVTAMAGWKDTYCEEPWLPARFKHAPCVVQGAHTEHRCIH